MEPEYDLSKMRKRPNPFAKQLKKQVTISLERRSRNPVFPKNRVSEIPIIIRRN
jgi:hypothetical protein